LVEAERPINASGPSYCNPATVPIPSGCQATGYLYTGRITAVTDPKGNTQSTTTDVNGWLRQAKDALGYTVYRSYDSAGTLTGVTDSVGNTLSGSVTVVYGIKPFITAATDADRGAWGYTIDSFGEKTGWKDANLNSFSMTYDALSRPLTRTDPITSSDPGLFTQWQYGSTPASFNVGKLISECSVTGNPTSCGSTPQYSENRYYDSTARLKYRWIIESGNPGNDTNPVTQATGGYLYTLGYNPSTGVLAGLTYPKSTSGAGDPLTLSYSYGSGLLQSVTDTSDTTATCGSTCVLWSATAVNAFGEVTKETLGNGVVTNRTYDAVTSWLTAATAGVGGGSGLLNQSYLQDKNGNVIQREATVGTESLYENFYYDADNRLCAVVLGGTGSCSSSTIVYDGGNPGPGNITNQPGVGAYTYPAPGQSRPHAVTSITGTFNGITNPTFSYDANGNMTDRASSGANIVWSSYNYPTSISASDVTGSEEVQFSYGPDRQRWKQTYTGPSGTEQTYYVGKTLEVVFNGTTNYRHYIYAGTEPVAVYSRTSAGANTMSYMLEDHQGGISAIASNSGAVDVDESFSAFGTRRNPSTWSGAPTSADLNTIAGLSRQGYTFQTWLGQSMGLNHMNGRVQDAILGRFLSPDPHIPDPTNAQSYNRYSYVNNNPLSNVDPTGFRGSKCPGGCVGPDQSFGTPDANGSPDGSYTYSDGVYSQPSGSSPPPINYTNLFNPDPFGAESADASAGQSAYTNFDFSSMMASQSGPSGAAGQGGCVGSPCLLVAATLVGTASGSSFWEGLGWIASALGSAGSVIGGALVPNLSIATEDQDSPGFTFYHGTATFSGGPLDAGASAANSNDFGSALGFYLASDPDTAAHFAAVAAEQSGKPGAVLQYQISNQALEGLQAAGSTIGPVPGGPSRYTSFPGVELFVPVTAYPAFNGFLSSGGITVVGAH
jgi:RHS repeat-associated protein